MRTKIRLLCSCLSTAINNGSGNTKDEMVNSDYGSFKMPSPQSRPLNWTHKDEWNVNG